VIVEFPNPIEPGMDKDDFFTRPEWEIGGASNRLIEEGRGNNSALTQLMSAVSKADTE
jgi:hypothetical protein